MSLQIYNPTIETSAICSIVQQKFSNYRTSKSAKREDERIKIISLDNIPSEFHLHQNFPNAFYEITRIQLDIAKHTHVKLNLYDFFGKKVAELINKEMDCGHYEVVFNNNDFKLMSGVYMYKLTAGEFSDTKKMVLLKLIQNN